jgi:hypothetical protein
VDSSACQSMSIKSDYKSLQTLILS